MTRIETDFTRLTGVRYPIICAPMFLVSNVDMMVAVAEAGGMAVFPTLNYRPVEALKEALKEIRSRTQKPFGVNLIVNKSNARLPEDLKICLDAGVPFFITSLGSPKEVISQAHKIGSKVVCDVINLPHAQKVEDLGGDGVIAVGAGAGGHAGPISPLVLIPWLKRHLKIPVIAAGGIANGEGLAAALSLGASAVSVGTRFIASKEAAVTQDYKSAIVRSTPEDIIMTSRITGTPAAIIKTPYTKDLEGDLSWVIKKLKQQKLTKPWITLLMHFLGSKALEHAAVKPTWKTVWSAGQSVGLVEEVLSCKEIIELFVKEYAAIVQQLPREESL